MLADLSFWEKLWNKGVDVAASIVASTISAFIIAVIATLTWGFKRRRDLELEEDKLRQKNRLELEFAKQKQTEDDSNRLRQLEKVRDDFASAAASAPTPKGLQDVWDRYLRWLHDKGLLSLRKNQEIVDTWGPYQFHTATPVNVPGLGKSVSAAVNSTQLSPEASSE
jgi:hypothetical protein